jgi:Na+/glutamate symporter
VGKRLIASHTASCLLASTTDISIDIFLLLNLLQMWTGKIHEHFKKSCAMIVVLSVQMHALGTFTRLKAKKHALSNYLFDVFRAYQACFTSKGAWYAPWKLPSEILASPDISGQND